MLIWWAWTSLRALRSGVLLFVVLISVVVLDGCAKIVPLNVSFAQSASTIQAYDFVEVTASVSWPRAKNPFTDAALSGWFESADGSKRWPVEGFCST